MQGMLGGLPMDIFMDRMASMKPSKNAPARRRRVDLHITLPTEEVQHLDRLAKDLSRTRNDLVCEAVTAYRIAGKKAAIQAAMRKDVETLAKENDKLLQEFEPHALEVLFRETEW